MAVSCTGIGEAFIKVVAAHQVSDRVRFAGENVEDAATATLDEVAAHHGDGGMIVLPAVGRGVVAYNSEMMNFGYRSAQGGKVQGFTFPFNADRVFSILHEGKRCNLQQDFQFFATPPEVADWLVMLAGGVHDDQKVLEPSAGTGAIIDAIHRSCPDVIVDCYELMPENKEILSKKDNIRILGDDFTKCDVAQYDKIIANPPFSKNQDIRHVRRMYECLNPGGVLAAITGPHWEFGSESECKDFRQWLEDNGGKKFEIEEGAFKESGTGTKTIAIVIYK